LDRNLSQPQEAKIIGVTTDTITLWENNQCLPRIGYTPKIIAFLGYNPLTPPLKTLSQILLHYRQQEGITRKKLAKKIGIDEATLTRLEEGGIHFQ
jgi:DNA-binding XRE family transcriptional regulator